MKKNYLIFFLLIVILFQGCSKKYPEIEIQNFEEFNTLFKKVVKERDIKTLDKLSGERITYGIKNYNGKYTREDILNNFDFIECERLLKYDYDLIVVDNYKDVYIPKGITKEKYTLIFKNQGKGWYFRGITDYKGDGGKPGQ